MVLQQNETRNLALLLQERAGALGDLPRQRQARIGVGDEDGLRAAADDFIGEQPPLGEVTGAGRAQDLVDRQRMAMADEVHVAQGQQPRVKERFDAGLSPGTPDAHVEQCLLEFVIGERALVEDGQRPHRIAHGNFRLGQRGQGGAAGLDRELLRAQLHGSVAFAEDGKLSILAPDVVRKLEQRFDFISHGLGRLKRGERET